MRVVGLDALYASLFATLCFLAHQERSHSDDYYTKNILLETNCVHLPLNLPISSYVAPFAAAPYCEEFKPPWNPFYEGPRDAELILLVYGVPEIF